MKKKKKKNNWYELVAMFDADEIKAIPTEGRAFLMGKVGGMNIVEVPRDTPQAQLGKMASWLEQSGIEALVVTEGVRFLKLKSVRGTEREALDAHLEAEVEAKRVAELPVEPTPIEKYIEEVSETEHA